MVSPRPTCSALKGMKEITAFVGLSEATLLKYRRAYPGMPMNKAGGIWFADPDRLDQFLRDPGNGDTEKWIEKGKDRGRA